MSDLEIAVSAGEIIDKITILQIKTERMEDAQKLLNVRKELEYLLQAWGHSSYAETDISELQAELKGINEELWVIEDDIREKESAAEFDQQFIELARSVYFTNDRRAEVKKRINLKLQSGFVEEKSYRDYRRNEAGQESVE